MFPETEHNFTTEEKQSNEHNQQFFLFLNIPLFLKLKALFHQVLTHRIDK